MRNWPKQYTVLFQWTHCLLALQLGPADSELHGGSISTSKEIRPLEIWREVCGTCTISTGLEWPKFLTCVSMCWSHLKFMRLYIISSDAGCRGCGVEATTRIDGNLWNLKRTHQNASSKQGLTAFWNAWIYTSLLFGFQCKSKAWSWGDTHCVQCNDQPDFHGRSEEAHQRLLLDLVMLWLWELLQDHICFALTVIN